MGDASEGRNRLGVPMYWIFTQTPQATSPDPMSPSFSFTSVSDRIGSWTELRVDWVPRPRRREGGRGR